MHSVLFLILAFFNAAGLFVLLGAEFLAMILVVVYVGAVAVLFLFVVMMLDIDFAELQAGLAAISAGRRADRRASSWPNWCWSSAPGRSAPARRSDRRADATPAGPQQHRGARAHPLHATMSITSRSPGLVLLVAMIGAIVLTLRHRPRRAPPDHRARRTRARAATAIEMRRRQTGAGGA